MKAKKDQPAFVVQKQKDETNTQSLARVVLSPSLLSALTIRDYSMGFAARTTYFKLLRYIDLLNSDEFNVPTRL